MFQDPEIWLGGLDKVRLGPDGPTVKEVLDRIITSEEKLALGHLFTTLVGRLEELEYEVTSLKEEIKKLRSNNGQ